MASSVDTSASDLFSLTVAVISTADAFAQDDTQSADLRAAAGRLRDAMKSFKGVAYRFRGLVPATTGSATQ
jgi:hypothetical protein